ncbi:sensor histidine kinase [Haematomicrobium sanguinis]|uniref:sensor histidine kinase n=1 Tax=Haematomicrobium sanguinis TaxID=479106 RepID=UPI000949AD66|nr:histidine kinase [Haematomicrobium sanguinis]
MSKPEATSAKVAGNRTGARTFAELYERGRGPVRRYMRRHPVATDLLACLVAAVPVLLSALFLAVSPGGEGILALAMGVVTVVTIFFRRRYPIVVFIAVVLLEQAATVLLNVGGTSYVGTYIVLYTVGSLLKPRLAYLLALGAFVLAVVSFLLTSERLRSDVPEIRTPLILILLGFIAATYFLMVFIGATIRKDREHEKELAAWVAEAQNLAGTHERTRIAREMHDVVAHSLSVMISLAEGARSLQKRRPEQVPEVLGQLSGVGRAALADMRRVLGVLREDGSDPSKNPVPAGNSIAELIGTFRHTGLPLTFTTVGPPLPTDPAFGLTVYRIVQEALTNILRYAPGSTRVEVSIAVTVDTVRIVAENDMGSLLRRDSAATTPQEFSSLGTGRGIKGMKERAAVYGGTAEVGPKVGASDVWRVDVLLKIPSEILNEQGRERGEKL